MLEEIRKAKEIVKTLCESHLRQRPDTIWDGYIDQMDQIETALNHAEEHEKELNELKEFVKLVGKNFYTEYCGQVLIVNGNWFPIKKEKIDFVMKVAKRYE